jgi:hypothetical protein
MKKMKPVQVLREFFGLKPGQTTAEFLAELKALSSDERRSLANDAAKEMGVEIEY